MLTVESSYHNKTFLIKQISHFDTALVMANKFQFKIKKTSRGKQIHGQSAPPPLNTIKEYFTPILPYD